MSSREQQKTQNYTPFQLSDISQYLDIGKNVSADPRGIGINYSSSGYGGLPELDSPSLPNSLLDINRVKTQDPNLKKSNISTGIDALTGLGNLYLGNKALGLSEDQFDFAKAQANRDFAAQAQNYNTLLENARRSHLTGQATYDTSTPEGLAQFEQDLQNYVTKNRISTTPL